MRRCKACGRKTRTTLLPATIVWPQRPSETGGICRTCARRSVTMRVVAGLPTPTTLEEAGRRVRHAPGVLGSYLRSVDERGDAHEREDESHNP